MSEVKLWSVEGYKEYCELCCRNFLLDNLWGDDELVPSAEYVKWTEMNKTYGSGVSNSDLLIAAYEQLTHALALSEAKLKKAKQLYALAKGITEAAVDDLTNYNQVLNAITLEKGGQDEGL